MYCLDSDTNNPYFNLAVEELLLRNSADEFFILNVNSTAVISGKHQCIHREVNTGFVTGNNIPVIRRISGGGTVFHDEGNLNFCFIRNCEAGKQIDFQRHTSPVIEFLKSLGLNPVLQGSDIRIDNLKISGNSEHVFRNRVLHHGTLLWNASLDNLRNCIRRDNSSYSTRAVASNPSPVTNLAERLSDFRDLTGFRAAMLNYFLEKQNESYELNDSERREAEDLSAKYKTWEWNYAYGPEYEFRKQFTFNGQDISIRLVVIDGIIRLCRMDGELKNLCDKLVGCRHMPEDISDLLKREDQPDLDPYTFF